METPNPEYLPVDICKALKKKTSTTTFYSNLESRECTSNGGFKLQIVHCALLFLRKGDRTQDSFHNGKKLL